MIRDGDDAPTFALPAVEDGAFRTVALEDYLGDDIVILAFYPAAFNPCCDGETTDLDELDLFTMQKDVSILGISGDSVYSHRSFAETYDLSIPLLTDIDGAVATDYGVAVDDPDAGYRTNRAVVVIDPDGEVQYAWQTEELTELPPVDDVREAVESVGGSDTAEARYRVGHAHYVEARRSFTSAMSEFENREWMMAQTDFVRACDEFDEATDQFNTAVRFAVSEETRTYFERAEKKSGVLSQAAEWLAESASAYASGEGKEGEQLRTDAEKPLETARDIHEPPPPQEFPPEEDPAEQEDERQSLLPTEEKSVPTLDTDIDEVDEAEKAGDTSDTSGDEASVTADGEQTEGAASDDEEAETDESGEEIDDEELEEIAAELEEQTKQAQRATETEDSNDDSVVPDKPASATETEDEDDQELTEEGKLDLADPNEGEADDDDEEDDESDEESAEDLGSGKHGVPDSL